MTKTPNDQTPKQPGQAGDQPLADAAIDALVEQAMAREAMAVPAGLAQRIAENAMAQPQEQPWQARRVAPRAGGARSWVWPVLWPSAASVAVSAMLGFMIGTGQFPVGFVPDASVAEASDPWADTDLIAGLTGNFGLGQEFDGSLFETGDEG